VKNEPGRKGAHEGVPWYAVMVGVIWRAFWFSIRWFFDFWLVISVWSFQLPEFGFDFDFDFDFDFGVTLPCFRLPTFSFSCTFTHSLNLLFLLMLEVAVFQIIVSADLISMIFDRLSRAQMFKLSLFQAEDRAQGALTNRFQQSSIMLLKEVIWKVFEVTMAMASTCIMELIWSFAQVTGHEICAYGSMLASKVLILYAFFVILMGISRLGMGTIHSNLAYILAKPLCETEENLCANQQMKRTVGIARISMGSMFVPFLPLCNVNDDLEEDLSKRLSSLDADVQKELNKVNNENITCELDEAAADESGCVIALTKITKWWMKMFCADSVVKATLCNIHQWDKKLKQQADEQKCPISHPLQLGGATVRDDLLNTLVCTADTNSEVGVARIFCAVKVMFGFWGQTALDSHCILARSQLWQAQIESIQRASANYFGVGLQIIPVAGIFLGKLTMYLNEHPTWIHSDEQSLVCRSFRADLQPHCPLIALWFCSLAKFGLLFVGILVPQHFAILILVIFLLVIVEQLIVSAWAKLDHNPVSQYADTILEEQKKKKKKGKKGQSTH